MGGNAVYEFTSELPIRLPSFWGKKLIGVQIYLLFGYSQQLNVQMEIDKWLLIGGPYRDQVQFLY